MPSRAKARISAAFSGVAEAVPFPGTIRETNASENARNFHLPEGTTLVTMHASFRLPLSLGIELVARL